MKKLFAVIILLSCIVPLACKKKTKTGIGYSVQPPKGLDTLVATDAKVNGQAWHTTNATGYKIKSVIDTNKIDLMVTATQNTGSAASTITFTITNYKGPATYTVDAPDVSATYFLANMRHFAGSGQIIVSSDGPYGVIGLFNFTADSIDVTEGAFNVAQP